MQHEDGKLMGSTLRGSSSLAAANIADDDIDAIPQDVGEMSKQSSGVGNFPIGLNETLNGSSTALEEVHQSNSSVSDEEFTQRNSSDLDDEAIRPNVETFTEEVIKTNNEALENDIILPNVEALDDEVILPNIETLHEGSIQNNSSAVDVFPLPNLMELLEDDETDEEEIREEKIRGEEETTQEFMINCDALSRKDCRNRNKEINAYRSYKKVKDFFKDGLELRLYDLHSDPNEKEDLSALHPGMVRSLLRRLLQELPRAQASDNPPMDMAGDPRRFGSVWSPGWC
ncbi:uncharacterized protein LOC108667820 [Hyalella azteca]|uniref:Uncharacterized protein LOC108667820 n=1 Tax=Hyalella azteca TaxID=294128 RepID=A0A8B7N9W7_HYAAZ|nr:uncharacterized protein LOC108667820 [Hyalella azteca]